MDGVSISLGTYHAPPERFGSEAQFEATFDHLTLALASQAADCTVLGGDANAELSATEYPIPGVGHILYGGEHSDRTEILTNFISARGLTVANSFFGTAENAWTYEADRTQRRKQIDYITVAGVRVLHAYPIDVVIKSSDHRIIELSATLQPRLR